MMRWPSSFLSSGSKVARTRCEHGLDLAQTAQPHSRLQVKARLRPDAGEGGHSSRWAIAAFVQVSEDSDDKVRDSHRRLLFSSTRSDHTFVQRALTVVGDKGHNRFS